MTSKPAQVESFFCKFVICNKQKYFEIVELEIVVLQIWAKSYIIFKFFLSDGLIMKSDGQWDRFLTFSNVLQARVGWEF